MKRPSNFSGDEASRFPHAVGELPASSPFAASGETVISFPGSSAAASAGDQEDAGVSPASASSFVSLGTAISPVILRLQGGFPRVKVLAGAPREEVRARRPSNQPVEEEGPD